MRRRLRRKAPRRVEVAVVLAALGLVVAGLAAVPGSADTDPQVSPVQFTACGSSLWTVPAGVTSVTADVFGGGPFGCVTLGGSIRQSELDGRGTCLSA